MTRGVRAESLIHNKQWWEGPEFLKDHRDQWLEWNPKTVHAELDENLCCEIKKPRIATDHVFLTTITRENVEIDLLDKISSLPKLCRITALVLRFVAKCYEPIRKTRKKNLLPLNIYSTESWKSDASVSISCGENRKVKIRRPSIIETDNAMKYWVRVAQKKAFPSEYQQAEKQVKVSGKSGLWSLTPIMDEDGLLRVTGRLNNSTVSKDEKQPVILDRKSPIAQRLAEKAHETLLHGGVQMCTQYLRNCWIVGLSEYESYCALLYEDVSLALVIARKLVSNSWQTYQ